MEEMPQIKDDEIVQERRRQQPPHSDQNKPKYTDKKKPKQPKIMGMQNNNNVQQQLLPENDVINNQFDDEKTRILNELTLTTPDKSRAGSVDMPIRSLVSTLNKTKNYYTTSSCAGRIILVQTTIGSGYSTDWLFVSHDHVSDINSIHQSLTQLKQEKGAEVWFNMEAFILAISCRDISSAQHMLDLCRMYGGMKRVSITSTKDQKIMMALIDTHRMECLIAKNGKMLVDKEYLSVCLEVANEKLTKTRNRMDRLEQAIKVHLLGEKIDKSLSLLNNKQEEENVHDLENDKQH